MEVNYLCPHCRGTLNIKDCVILSAKTSKNEVGLILLHPEIGNYTIDKSPAFNLEPGEKITFYCSICHSNLNNSKNEDFANLLYIEINKQESLIVFSKTYGEKSTYKIDDKKILSYGEHCKKYDNPDWFI